MKSTITRIILATAMSLAGLFAVQATAAPLLDITISPNPVQGAPGQDVQIDFTLTNLSNLDLNNFSLNTVSPNPTLLGILDTSFFFDNGVTLTPGDALLGFALFTFDVGAPLNAVEFFDVEFAFQDAAGGLAGPTLYEAASFEAMAVPEPATMALLAMALAGAAAARRRRN